MKKLTIDFTRHYSTGDVREADSNAYQWDTGHVLEAIVPGTVQSAEVHYSGPASEKADPFLPDSITTDSDGNSVITSKIPNQSFEHSGRLTAYIVVTDDSANVTEYEGRIVVLNRPKPVDYVSDPTDNAVKSITDLVNSAKSSATAAAKSASDADASAQVASAATTSATNAATSESNAKTYASNASDSAMSAASSAASIKASADQIAANKKALQTPTTVTDPTSKTVLLAGSQGIDYSKLADAIIAKYTGQTLAGKAQAVKTALDLVKNQTDGIIDVVNGTTTKDYASGDFFQLNNKTYVARTAIASGTALTDSTVTSYATALSESALNSLSNSIAGINETLTEYVNKSGIGEVTPQNLQIVDAEISPNLIDESKITNNTYITADGTEHTGNYFVTDYIPVEAGEKYVFTCEYKGNRGSAGMRFVACYDNKKTVMPSAGSNTEVSQPYTIPNGVSYIIISTYYSTAFTKYQFEKGAESTAYHPYGEVISAEIKREYIPQEDVDMADIPAFHLVEGQNLINKDDADYVVGKYVTRDGLLRDSTAYATTGFIAVTPGDTLLGSYLNSRGVTTTATLVYIAAYDSNKTVVVNSGVTNGLSTSYTVPDGIYYVRCSIRVASFTSDIQITRTDSGLPKPYKPYEASHYEILDSYTPQGKPPLHVYLPSDIYVAVGRTIELYNEQICIDHDKYHFRWVCAEGSAYERKFSITGTTVRNLSLDLYLYDDKRNICWCGRCVIHVVAASNPTKKILPIGDSLTNWKAWLQETMLLSGNHITWVGTRYSGQSADSAGNVYASGTIHHEGRSGWKASDYLSNATYDFDNRYDGVGTVAGTANPFWDGTKFSLAHYLSVQTGVNTPDAVQIFLGTNDIRLGIEPATENIVAIVQSIRTEYPSMPIFVCNTIYNSNQNGYGRVGSDAYASSAGANAWQYEQDCLVMDLMKSLKTALASYTGVYIIPLASCMDREYDFGQVMTKVNPRSDIEIAMPVERIHPQNPGYYQMADLMYSYYCGLLT